MTWTTIWRSPSRRRWRCRQFEVISYELILIESCWIIGSSGDLISGAAALVFLEAFHPPALRRSKLNKPLGDSARWISSRRSFGTHWFSGMWCVCGCLGWVGSRVSWKGPRPSFTPQKQGQCFDMNPVVFWVILSWKFGCCSIVVA